MGSCYTKYFQKNALEVIYSHKKYYISKKKMYYIKTMEDFLKELDIHKSSWKRLETSKNEPLFGYSTFRIVNFTIIRLDNTREPVIIKALYRKN
jgi:hypothetical protein